MKELSIELYLNNGECKDDSGVVVKTSEDIINRIKGFLEDFYNDGYSECDPRYYDINQKLVDKLYSEEYVRVGSTLSVSLWDVEDEQPINPR